MPMQQVLVGLGGGGGPLGSQGNPYQSWTDLRSQNLTNNSDNYLQLAGHTYKVAIDDSGFAKFSINGNYYTRYYYGNGINTCCGSASHNCNNMNSYTAGNRHEWATESYTGWNDWGWRDAAGTLINNAWFTAFAGQMNTGYRSNQWWLGHNDLETNGCLGIKYSDGSTDGDFSINNNSGNGDYNCMSHDYTGQLNGWVNNNKVWTSMKTNAGGDPAAMIITWRHSGMCIK